MTKRIIEQHVWKATCGTCKTKFSYEFTDTFSHESSDFRGERYDETVVTCPVCETRITHPQRDMDFR